MVTLRQTRRALSHLATGILVLSALTLATLAVFRTAREVNARPPQTEELKKKPPLDSWVVVSVGDSAFQQGQWLGTPTAPVRILEFTDYQCPYCRVLADSIRVLEARFQGLVALSVRHFPLSEGHPHAIDAAMASECAGEQGAFPSFYALVYAHQNLLGHESWARLAQSAKVADIVRFDHCMRSKRYQARIDRDIAFGRELGVVGTPTLVVNGRMHAGAVSLTTLSNLVIEALRRRPSSVN
jgi:protein-disulfide isomerase